MLFVIGNMKYRTYSVSERQKVKTRARADDLIGAQKGRGAELQKRNGFIPNPKDWTIESVPKPLKGETLD